MKSEAEEYSAQSVQWTVPSAHAPVVGIAGDKGLLLAKEAQKYAFGHALDISVKNKDLIVQFEVKFEKSLECGGAYIKLLRDSIDMKELKSDTPYLIMVSGIRTIAIVYCLILIRSLISHRMP